MKTWVERRRSWRHAVGLLNVALGGWLAVSPWVFRYTDAPRRTSDFVVGAAIAVVGFVSLGANRFLLANVALGAWLIVSALVQRHEGSSLANHLLVGAAVLASAWAAARLRGGGRPIRPVVP